jgi:regulator of replication initiation timing
MRRNTMNDLITITNGIAVLDSDIASRIADFERKLKDIKEAEDKLKQGVLEEMQEKGILKIETEEMTISYKASYDRESFDSKKFREEYSDLYDSYVRMTSVKPSITIKVK